MNYLGLIALCLGILAVFITITQMNSHEKIREDIKNIRTKCILVDKHDKSTDLLKDFQNDTQLSIDEIKRIILDYKKRMERKVNSESAEKEEFKNYHTNTLDKKNTDLLYSSAQSRGILMHGNKAKKHIDYNRINELKNIVGGYEDLFMKTFNRILGKINLKNLITMNFKWKNNIKKMQISNLYLLKQLKTAKILVHQYQNRLKHRLINGVKLNMRARHFVLKCHQKICVILVKWVK